MKFIQDYTQEELVALTDEEVEKIIKVTLADNGLIIPVCPTMPSLKEIQGPDTIVYTVAGIESDICFTKKEIAEDAANILRSNYSLLRRLQYDYNIGGEYKRVDPINTSYHFARGIESIIVVEKRVYSQELYNRIHEDIEQNKKLEDQYDKLKETYDKQYEEAQEIRDEVWDAVNNARDKQYAKETKLNQFKEYLELADQNVDIAWKFMKKAYSVSQEEENYINANLK